MPTFDTPEPVSVVVTLRTGDTRVIASDRAHSVVEIRSSLGGDPDDGELASVELVNGQLTVTEIARKRRGPWGLEWRDLIGAGNSSGLEVTIEVPTGSRLQVDTQYGIVQAEGTLGACRVRSGYGEITLERTGPVELRCRHGEVVVAHVDGHAEIALSSGDVTVHMIDGTANVTNDHSDVEIVEVTGAVRLCGSHGDLTVGRAHADVRARSAYGSVRVREAVAGVVDLTTTYGELEVGIAAGTAAWLDISSGTGTVHNRLTARPGPEGFDRTVEVHARARDGNVVIRRA